MTKHEREIMAKSEINIIKLENRMKKTEDKLDLLLNLLDVKVNVSGKYIQNKTIEI